MKKHLYPLILFLICIVLWSGNHSLASHRAIQSGPQEVKEIIEAKNRQIEEWIAAGQIDSAATIFAEDVIQLPPNQKPIEGIDAYRQTWNQLTSTGKWQFHLDTREVKMSGELAVELGDYKLDYTPNEDSSIPAFSDYGTYVVLWEKINGEWKIVWDAPVSQKPMTPPSTASKN